MASCPLQGAPRPLGSTLGLVTPAAVERTRVSPTRCPGLTPGFGSARPRRRPGRAIPSRRPERPSRGGAGSGPRGRGEARAEHVTAARGAGRAVPRGGGGGESNGGHGLLRAGRAAGAAAAAEAPRTKTFPGRLSLAIVLSTAAPRETTGEPPSVSGIDNGQRMASPSGPAHAGLRPCPGH